MMRALLGCSACAIVLWGCGSGDGGAIDAIDATESPGIDADESPIIDAATPDAMIRADAAPLGAGVSTLAGWSQPGNADGPRDTAAFNNPVNVEVGPDGNIYVCDYDNSLLRRVTPDGVTTTLTGQADFDKPFGIVFATDGKLYVQTDANDLGARDRTTGTIWRVNTTTGAAAVVARNIGRPRGLAALDDGRLVIVDINTHVVRLLDPDADTPTPVLLAGAAEQAGDVDATGAAARFNQPYGAVITSDGDILVADQLNHKIRRITLAGVVTTFAGTGAAGALDGDRLTASFNEPQDLAVDAAGNVYVSDSGSYKIRVIDTSGQVSTIAGEGAPGYRDGDAMTARFYGMEGLAVTSDSTFVYVGDGNRGDGQPHHRVRRLDLID